MFATRPPPGALRTAIEAVAVASPWVTWKRARRNCVPSSSRHPLGALYVSSFAGSFSCWPDDGTARPRYRQAVTERIPEPRFALSMMVFRAKALGGHPVRLQG